MPRDRRQSGYTRTGKLILLLIVLAVGYFGYTFWPMATTWYDVRGDTKKLAARLNQVGANQEDILRKYLAFVAADRGITLKRGDIDVQRPAEGHVNLRVQLLLPYRFPFTPQQRFWKVEIEESVERLRSF